MKDRYLKIMLPVGLLCISASFIIKQLTHVNDFFSGFLIGFGIVMVIAGFIKTKRIKDA